MVYFLDGITKMGGVFLIIPLAGLILIIKLSTITFPHIIEFLLITKGNDLFCEFLPGPNRFLKFQPGKDVIFDQLTPYAGETFTGPPNCLPKKCSVQ